MDKQRIQSCLKLTEQLLACKGGQESSILQANLELVDAGLLEVMEQVSVHLKNQGNNTGAEWLRNFARKLGRTLSSTSSPLTIAAEAEEFWHEILKLIATHQGDPKTIYPIWAEQKDRFNQELLDVLPTVVTQLMSDNQEQRKSIALIFSTVGDLIQRSNIGAYWLNLELSIAVYQQCLSVITQTEFPVVWATIYHNLSTAYFQRMKGDKAENIEASLAACERALTVITQAAMPREWAAAQTTLGNAHLQRVRGDRTENIEAAITIYQDALKVVSETVMPEKWATIQMNLATAYCERTRGEKDKNIEVAISAYEDALRVKTRTAMPIEWATVRLNLANAYLQRIQGDRATNTEAAIAACEDALIVMTQTAMPSKWAFAQITTANSYFQRVQGDSVKNFKKAISAYQNSLKVITKAAMPVEWATVQMNIAIAYRSQENKVENVQAAIAACEKALTIFTPEILPDDCCRTAGNLGYLYSKQQCWFKAKENYQIATKAAELMYQSAGLLEGKGEILTKTTELYCRASYAMVRTGELEAAIEMVEQFRARGLSESLDRDRTNFDKLKAQNDPLYTQYKDITNQLRNLEALQRDLMAGDERNSLTPKALRDKVTRLRIELTATLGQIRQQPGYETFLTLPTYEDVQKATTPECPLTYLLTTPAGSIALIVSLNKIHLIWLNDFTDTQLKGLLKVWLNSYRTFKNNQTLENKQTWYNTIDQITNQLWGPLIGPMVQKIQAKGFHRITLIPTGYLSLLPLHSAWTPDSTQSTGRRYALDDLQITYVPNAKSLTAAKDIVKALNASEQAETILAIDDPRHRVIDPKTNQYKPVSHLPSSSQEVSSATATFQAPRILRHNHATREAVLDALPHTTILHCSCHGNANLQTPLNSGLAMAGDGETAVLTLKDVLALKLSEKNRPGLRLAILSACETGIQGLENANEAVSLPTGLLQAGVAAVIASLWAVNDLSTMLLLTKFYDLWRKDGLEPSQALRQAQIWLRDSTAGEIAATGLLFIPPDTPPELVNQRPYAHPYHWAAFSYTGI